MRVFTFVPKNYFGSNTYIFESCGVGAVIDPSVSFSEVCSDVLKNRIEIRYILITHAHFDHFLEIDSWVSATGAEVIVGKADAPALQDSALNCYLYFTNSNNGYYGKYRAVSEGDVIRVGESELNVIETPGHSKGSVSFFTDGIIFVGDVLFAGGGFGRVDLPGGDYRILMQSIKRILTFPQNTKVYCGHGEETAISLLKTNFI